MIIQVEVESGPNCDMDVFQVFEGKGEPREVARVMAVLPDGSEGLCQVTGWSAGGPCPAYAVRVSDSGEGAALLVYGGDGDGGIRLKEASSTARWDVDDPTQWGEPFLLLGLDVQAA